MTGDYKSKVATWKKDKVENLAKEKLKVGDTVLVEQKNFSIIRKSKNKRRKGKIRK